MCGIGGIVRARPETRVGEEALRRIAGTLRHRGPDGFGLAMGSGAGFVSTRLAIFDVPGGWQPMQTAPGGSLIIYNGEVYNHPELRARLSAQGVRCRTLSDTEVVLRLLDRHGLATLDQLNGQFAFAWWQPRERRLTLVRDRFGVRPLHYALTGDGDLVFASEAKGLFASREVAPEPDFAGVDDVFTLWGARPPRTTFRGVTSLPPGGLVVWEDGRIVSHRTWWRPDFSVEAAHNGSDAEELGELLRDSVRLRLRADVSVGTYLSGGLDSSLITAMASRESDHPLHTFSVAFAAREFDESVHQEKVAAALGTVHHSLRVGPDDIAGAFRDVVRHVESPMIRTAPVPMYLLSRATREHGITVVATGEGADELFWGYDLFKEVVLRREATHDRSDSSRFGALYPHLAVPPGRRGAAWNRFFTGAGDETDPLFSHQTRAAATNTVKLFFRPELAEELRARDSMDELRARLPSEFSRWNALERTGYLELTTLLEPYLLAAQGDRVALAHGVEGRYPFLDHRVFEHSIRLRPERKLDGMHDKVILRELAADLLPVDIVRRDKQPYRAPEVASFFAPGPRDWVRELLSPDRLNATGVFDGKRVQGLVRRCVDGRATGFRESMALVGILSTQVWFDTFFASPCAADDETRTPRVVIDMSADRAEARS